MFIDDLLRCCKCCDSIKFLFVKMIYWGCKIKLLYFICSCYIKIGKILNGLKVNFYVNKSI